MVRVTHIVTVEGTCRWDWVPLPTLDGSQATGHDDASDGPAV